MELLGNIAILSLDLPNTYFFVAKGVSMFWAVCFFSGVVLLLIKELVEQVLDLIPDPPDKPRMVCLTTVGPVIMRPQMVLIGGVKEWYLNGNLHREDGPAILYPDGSKEWFLNGVRTKVEWATENLSWRAKRDEENYWRDRLDRDYGEVFYPD